MALRPTDTAEFALRAAAWSLGFLGLVRLTWFATHVVLPLTRAQGMAAAGLFGAPAVPIDVTLACSGGDALALCLGSILAYPVPWRARVAGAIGGAALVSVLNTVRIGTLGQAAASEVWFNLLHVYVWPAALLLVIAGYVFAWMRFEDGASPAAALAWRAQPVRRFLILMAAFVTLFVALSPTYLDSPRVLALAGFITRSAVGILGAFGTTAYAAGNIMWTPRGGFLVTQECIATPLVPVYLAAICAFSTSWRRLMLGVVATLPLFTALAIVRLLVAALPSVDASPLFFVHAFYQLLLGTVVVVAAALWRHERRTALGHAAIGVVLGGLFIGLIGPVLTRAVSQHTLSTLDDPQGAIAFLPAFQFALYLALWIAAFASVGWRRFAAGLAALGLTQSAGIFALHALASQSGLTAHVRDVRAWAIAGPVLIFAAVITSARAAR